MAVKIDPKEMLRRLAEKKPPKRAKISFYLDKDLYDDFKKACGDKVPVYKMIEDFMQQVVEGLKRK